jgi:hypothetical protein
VTRWRCADLQCSEQGDVMLIVMRRIVACERNTNVPVPDSD